MSLEQQMTSAGSAPSAGDAPSAFTLEDVPALLKEPEFQALPHSERSAALEDVLNGAFQDAAQEGMSSKDHVAFGEFANEARQKAAEGWGEWSGRKLKGGGESLLNLGKGLGALAFEGNPATLAYRELHAANSAFHGRYEDPFAGLKTIAGAAASHLESRPANFDEWMRKHATPEGHKLNEAVDDIFSKIDKGEMSFDSAEARAKDVRDWSDKLQAFQEKYHGADLLGGDPDAPPPTPAETERRAAAAKKLTAENPLTRPENVSLLATYMATRNPAAKEQLKANLFRTSNVSLADANREAILNSPGAKQFEETFGKGSAQHLYSGADPVNLAMMALPFARGVGAVGEAASALEKAATFAGEQTAFGVDSAIQQNPSDPAYLENIGNMLLVGGAMHTGGRVLKAVTGKGEATPERTSETTETVPSSEAETVPMDKSTDTVASELFNNTGKEGASDAEFSGLDAKVDATQGVEPTPESAARFAESTPETPPVEATPVAPPEPPPVKYRTFDAHGRLKASKEAPHAEAMKEMRGRESMLQKILDCLTKKLAS